jgi:thiamine pyrophosphokinase
LSNTEISRAVVVANGDVPVTSQFAGSLPKPGDGTLVVAADGGLHVAEQLGLRPDIVVGDGDSLSPGVLDRLRREGVEVQLHPPAKDASDTELALREALRRGAKRSSSLVRWAASASSTHWPTCCCCRCLSWPVVTFGSWTADRLSACWATGQSLSLSVDDGELVSLLPLTEKRGRRAHPRPALPARRRSLEQGTTRGLSNEMTAGAARSRWWRSAGRHTHQAAGGGMKRHLTVAYADSAACCTWPGHHCWPDRLHSPLAHSRAAERTGAAHPRVVCRCRTTVLAESSSSTASDVVVLEAGDAGQWSTRRS